MEVILAGIDLWNPHGTFSLGGALTLAFLLGLVHGVTPDEHTWPITFSYSIGSYSTRKGLVSGLIFSAAFTLQRAIASELAYYTLARFFTRFAWLDYAIYVVVGVAMFVAARYLFKGEHWHLLRPAHHLEEWRERKAVNQPKPWMPAVHGFIAGWGFGAFALIIYTVLAPAMPSGAIGWLPGALFGLGTVIVQSVAGAAFGLIARRAGLAESDIRMVSLVTAGRTLLVGGIAFTVAGLLGLAFPRLMAFGYSTGIHVHNLDTLGIAQILVVVSVVLVGFGTLVGQTRQVKRMVIGEAGRRDEGVIGGDDGERPASS